MSYVRQPSQTFDSSIRQFLQLFDRDIDKAAVDFVRARSSLVPLARQNTIVNEFARVLKAVVDETSWNTHAVQEETYALLKALLQAITPPQAPSLPHPASWAALPAAAAVATPSHGQPLFGNSDSWRALRPSFKALEAASSTTAASVDRNQPLFTGNWQPSQPLFAEHEASSKRPRRPTRGLLYPPAYPDSPSQPTAASSSSFAAASSSPLSPHHLSPSQKQDITRMIKEQLQRSGNDVSSVVQKLLPRGFDDNVKDHVTDIVRAVRQNNDEWVPATSFTAELLLLHTKHASNVGGTADETATAARDELDRAVSLFVTGVLTNKWSLVRRLRDLVVLAPSRAAEVVKAIDAVWEKLKGADNKIAKKVRAFAVSVKKDAANLKTALRDLNDWASENCSDYVQASYSE